MRTTPSEKIRDYRSRGWWDDTRIHDMFDAHVRAFPDRTALVDAPNRPDLLSTPPLRLSWRETADLADGFAVSLETLGLGRDDLLVTQLPNIAEYPALYIAALRLGIIVSPVPMQFRRHELEQIVRLTGARTVLTVDAFKGADHIGMALQSGATLAAEGIALRVLSLRSAAGGDTLPEGAIAFTAAPADDPRRATLSSRCAALGVDADDIATICWTSGT